MAYSNPDPQSPVVLNVAVSTPLSPVDLERRFCIVSCGDTTLSSGTLQEIAADEIASIFTGTYTSYETYLRLVAYFANNSNGSVFVLETGAVVDSDPGDQVAALAAHITAGIGVCGHYAVPNIFYGDADFAALVLLYATDRPIYKFYFHITHGTAPADQTAFAAVATKSDSFLVYPSATSGEDALGAMFGVMASSKYDVSPTNKMTPLQYSKITGITAENLNTTTRNALTNNAVNYVGTIQSVTMIFNGRMSDNFSWDYRFSELTTLADIENSLLALIVNGANVPAASVPYNQNGIDKLLAVANARAKYRKSCQMVNDYAESLNDTGTELVNLDTFLATDFYTYKAANPSDYTAGIYQGLSGIIDIQKFFRKVVFNLTLV